MIPFAASIEAAAIDRHNAVSAVRGDHVHPVGDVADGRVDLHAVEDWPPPIPGRLQSVDDGADGDVLAQSGVGDDERPPDPESRRQASGPGGGPAADDDAAAARRRTLRSLS